MKSSALSSSGSLAFSVSDVSSIHAASAVNDSASAAHVDKSQSQSQSQSHDHTHLNQSHTHPPSHLNHSLELQLQQADDSLHHPTEGEVDVDVDSLDSLCDHEFGVDSYTFDRDRDRYRDKDKENAAPSHSHSHPHSNALMSGHPLSASASVSAAASPSISVSSLSSSAKRPSMSLSSNLNPLGPGIMTQTHLNAQRLSFETPLKSSASTLNRSYVAELDSQYSLTVTKLKRTEGDLSRLEHRYRLLHKFQSHLDAQNNELRARCTQLETQSAKQQQAKADAQQEQELDSQSQSVSLLQQKIDSLTAQLADLRQAHTQLQHTHAQAEVSASQQDEIMHQLHAQIKHKQQCIDDLHSQRDNDLQQKQSLQSQLQHLQTHDAHTVAELEAALTLCAELQEENEIYRRNHSSTNNQAVHQRTKRLSDLQAHQLKRKSRSSSSHRDASPQPIATPPTNSSNSMHSSPRASVINIHDISHDSATLKATQRQSHALSVQLEQIEKQQATEHQLVTVQTQLATVQDEREQLQLQLTRVEADRVTLQKQTQSQSQIIDQFECQLSEAREELYTLQYSSQTASIEHATVVDQLADTRFKLRTLSQQCTAMQTMNQELQSNVTQLQNAQQKAKEASLQQEKNLAQLTSDRDAARAMLSSTLDELNSTRAEASTSCAQVASTRTELASIRTELASARSELTSSLAEAASSRAELASSRTEASEALNKLDALTASLDAVKLRLEIAEQAVLQHKRRSEELNSSVAQLKSEVTASAARLIQVEKQRIELAKTVEQQTTLLHANNLRIQDLQHNQHFSVLDVTIHDDKHHQQQQQQPTKRREIRALENIEQQTAAAIAQQPVAMQSQQQVLQQPPPKLSATQSRATETDETKRDSFGPHVVRVHADRVDDPPRRQRKQQQQQLYGTPSFHPATATQAPTRIQLTQSQIEEEQRAIHAEMLADCVAEQQKKSCKAGCVIS